MFFTIGCESSLLGVPNDLDWIIIAKNYLEREFLPPNNSQQAFLLWRIFLNNIEKDYPFK